MRRYNRYKIWPYAQNCKWILNYPKGKLTIWAPRATVYQIEENYEKQAWTLVDDSIKTVFGYECQLTTCTFRGRTYKAWYTAQLPYSEGPWKFNGLPGLITEVYDTKNHYHFTLVSLKQNNVTPVCFYNIRSELQPEVEKISRIDFLKQLPRIDKYDFIREFGIIKF